MSIFKNEEELDALDAAGERLVADRAEDTRVWFADTEHPVFDGPQKPLPMRVNTEADE